MFTGISKEALEKLLAERKAMCSCGCGWGESDGHEWEILLLEDILKNHMVTIPDPDVQIVEPLPEFLKKQAD